MLFMLPNAAATHITCKLKLLSRQQPSAGSHRLTGFRLSGSSGWLAVFEKIHADVLSRFRAFALSRVAQKNKVAKKTLI
jgi:hypothetical protein